MVVNLLEEFYSVYITNATNTKQGGNSSNQTHVEQNNEDNLQLQATLLQPDGVKKKNIEQDLTLVHYT